MADIKDYIATNEKILYTFSKDLFTGQLGTFRLVSVAQFVYAATLMGLALAVREVGIDPMRGNLVHVFHELMMQNNFCICAPHVPCSCRWSTEHWVMRRDPCVPRCNLCSAQRGRLRKVAELQSPPLLTSSSQS